MAAYIQLLIEGNKNFGGYISSNGNAFIEFEDDMTYEFSPGHHEFEISEGPDGTGDVWTIEADLRDGEMLQIVSHSQGRTLYRAPQYKVEALDRETLRHYEKVFAEQDGKAKNKWISVLLCLFLGGLGAHKFYEGKMIMGILYLFTMGLFGIGWLIDLLVLLGKPNPYYVK